MSNTPYHTASQQHIKLLDQQSQANAWIQVKTQVALAEAGLEAYLQKQCLTNLRPHGARHLWMQQ
jgi:hypothetical protein